MRAQSSKEFKSTVENVLKDVEKRSGVSTDSPDFIALKSLLKRRVLEVESAKGVDRPVVRDWTRGRFHRSDKPGSLRDH
jgi:hypothetical protein